MEIQGDYIIFNARGITLVVGVAERARLEYMVTLLYQLLDEMVSHLSYKNAYVPPSQFNFFPLFFLRPLKHTSWQTKRRI